MTHVTVQNNAMSLLSIASPVPLMSVYFGCQLQNYTQLGTARLVGLPVVVSVQSSASWPATSHL